MALRPGTRTYRIAGRGYGAGMRAARGVVKALRRRGVNRATAIAWWRGFSRSFQGSIGKSLRRGGTQRRYRATRTFADYS